MNKKFSTLLAAALFGTFSAFAVAPTNGKLHQIKIGTEGTQVLSVVKNKAKTADSLVVVDAPKSSDIMKDVYKKSLWKFASSKVDNTQTDVWTMTNYATGSVLSLDLSKEGASFVSNGQSKWLVSADGKITAIKNGDTYSIQLQYLDKDGEVVDAAVEGGKTRVIVKKNNSAEAFNIAKPTSVGAMTAAQINGLYGTSSVLDFDKNLDGNPIDGVAFRAVATDDASYVNVRLNSGKYLVVDSAQWTNTVNNNVYFKLATDALPTEAAKEGSVNAAVEAELLKNGRAADFYAFQFKLDIAAGYVVTITPKGVPTYAPTTPEENKAHAGMSYDVAETTRALVYGKFANSLEVLTATAASGDKLTDAKATFGVAETPDALDADYTYYVQYYNKYKKNADETKWLSDSRYKKYEYLNCDGAKKEDAKASLETPAYMWYLTSEGSLKNMMAEETDTESPIEGAIILINEKEGVYAFGTDTVKLTKGPKVEDAKKMGYKVVTKADEVNGALSFRLVSLLADDLYMVSNKDNFMYVANSELADAQKLKVVAAEVAAEEGEEAEYATVGNKVVKPVYYITDRLGKNVLVSADSNYKLEAIENENGSIENENALKVSFLSMGKDNQYKIVYGEDEESAITANAASGILEEGTKCDDKNVIFEFATQEAPAYGAPAIGHVQISTMEDDNKVIANQKDGFAALKAEGQSILKSDVYTQDTLTMWLDTACVTFDETMPLYYISTKTFNAEAETRNFLINPANISAEIEKNNEDPDAAEIENIYDYAHVAGDDTYRAAFAAASVCGLDSIAIDGDTIGLMQLNPAAVAFEVAAEISDEAYRIVSKLHAKNEEYDAEVEGSLPYVESETTLYLAQLNNVLFWTEDQAKAEIFVINRASTPTSNEGFEAESAVKVIAGNGTVTVQGAAGQTVTIATVLGKAVADEVVASDNATIAAPAGVVFVTVNGETTKVVVK
ncbi:hypothetical protein DXC95_08635 [Parabacteroides sp. 20_3]|jgi:hypothetical protein|uniref:DUF6383 domain-containing protein n=1 Tax=Parabacteroides sp. 20_3 TaxID=469591 RepID=UPI000EEF9058|nr:DUF6383 domain-containing protein [Parabacteroides sp. 20_3]RGK77035.1 hypothetical protein DXC95_08635 [Parabacteroides sp. 20_3]